MNIQEKIEYLKINYNPYTILNVSKDDTNEKIENEFKRLLLKTHPDKGGHSELFNLVKKAYNDIYIERKSNSGINNYSNYNSLKNNYNNFVDNQPKYENKNMNSNNFDNDRFNKIYDENRMYNLNDDGYGEWAKNEKSNYQPQKIKGDFNSHFNKNNKNELQKYIVPDEMYANNNLDCEELGIRKIDDYTKGFSMTDNKLRYTDLKRALGGNEFIIDNNEKVDERNIDSYTSKRDSCIHEVNELENNYYKQKEIEDKNYETNRMISLHQMDTEIANHFAKVNGLMISR